MGQENIELSPYIRGFESDSPESLGEKITSFLTENSAVELKEVKYSSYGFIHNLNRETSYSALVICNKNKKL